MNSDAQDIMTIEDVAEYLRIPVSSVYKLAQSGKIPATKIGRHWRFYRPTLVSWFTSQTAAGAFFEQNKPGTGKLDFS